MSAEKLLFQHCKQGDLDGVRHVVEVNDIELNVRDRWDSTPLYYACLCGHKDIVEYLLQNGSKCEASTFDGERCLYGALTNEIRNILRSWKQIDSNMMRRDHHQELLRRIFENDTLYKDIFFDVSGVRIGAHRCLLAARSSFFLDSLLTRWLSKPVVTLRHDRVCPEVFQLMLKFLYVGHVDIPQEFIADFRKLATHCKLLRLLVEIDEAEEKLSKLVHLKPSMGKKVKILTVESDDTFSDLRQDLRELAESCLPVTLRTWIDEGVLPFFYESISYYPDICVEVENLQFYCHQVFLCSHSDFFKAVISDHFQEQPQPTSEILTIKLRHLSAEIFRHIIIYIYSGKTEFGDIDEALEVLVTADMMLLLGLKKMCGGILSDCVSDENVIELYQCSQIYNLPNLEDSCTTFIANAVENFVECDDFMSLVTEQAYQVQAREEIDSIPIIDDIRHCITSAATTMGEIEEANSKLAKLDAMLARLGIEC